jgi:phosphate transport system substrate-binding protein
MSRAFFVTVLIAFVTALVPASGRADIDTRLSSNHVEIRGSTTVLPLGQAMAEKYMADHPGSTVVVTAGHSLRGIKAALVGTADIAMATSYLPPEYEKLERERQVKLTRYDVFRDGVVVVVNPANKVGDLSMKQLRDIFRGAVTNWKDVGGNDGPITVVSAMSTSGTYETFKNAVLHEDAVLTPKAKHLEYPDLAKTLNDDVNAIGFVGSHSVAKMKALSLNGVAPTEDDIKNERYPIFRILSLYVRQPVPPIAKDLIENYFLGADKGQAFVKSKGDIPVR